MLQWSIIVWLLLKVKAKGRWGTADVWGINGSHLIFLEQTAASVELYLLQAFYLCSLIVFINSCWSRATQPLTSTAPLQTWWHEFVFWLPYVHNQITLLKVSKFSETFELVLAFTKQAHLMRAILWLFYSVCSFQSHHMTFIQKAENDPDKKKWKFEHQQFL